MNILDHISKSLHCRNNFWVQILKFFDADPGSGWINGTKKKNNKRKNSDPGWKKFGSGINILDLQHCSWHNPFYGVLCGKTIISDIEILRLTRRTRTGECFWSMWCDWAATWAVPSHQKFYRKLPLPKEPRKDLVVSKPLFWARICKALRSPGICFPAWRAGRTTLLDVPACQSPNL